MTREQEIRERLIAATYGKWKVVSDLPFYAIACGDIDITPSTNRLYRNKTWHSKIFGIEENNAEFIAHSKDDIGYLLERVALLDMLLEKTK